METRKEDNIIYFTDFTQKFEPVKTEDDRFDESFEIDFGSYDDVDDFLSGANSYEYKLKYLQNERNKMLKMIEYIDDSQNYFTQSDYYLDGMQNMKKEVSKDFKAGSFISFMSTAFGGFFTYEFLHLLLTQQGDNFINIILGLVALGLDLFSIYNIKDTIIDYRVMKNYEKQIKNYNKILERRLQ